MQGATVPAVDEVRALCRSQGRPDLDARLTAATQLGAQTGPVVVVAGDQAQGKSALVNALVGYSVCPEGPQRSTAVTTRLRYGDHTEAHVRSGDDDVAVAIPFADVARWAAPLPTERHRLGTTGSMAVVADAQAVDALEVRVPAEALRDGLVLVDAVGAEGFGAVGRLCAMTELPGTAALLYVRDATGEVDPADLRFLAAARSWCPLVALVVTKIDLVPGWRRVVERNRQLLAGAGLADVVQLPVSARLAAWAAYQSATGPPVKPAPGGSVTVRSALGDLSGVERLRAHLRRHVVEAFAQRRREVAVLEAARCLQHLSGQAAAELAGLLDPERDFSDGDRPGTPDGSPLEERPLLEERRLRSRRVELQARRAELRRAAAEAAGWPAELRTGLAALDARLDADAEQRLSVVIDAAERLVTSGRLPAPETYGAWLSEQFAELASVHLAQARHWEAELVEHMGALLHGDLVAVGRALGAGPDPSGPGVVEFDARATTAEPGAVAPLGARVAVGAVALSVAVASQGVDAAVGGAPAVLVGVVMAVKAGRRELRRSGVDLRRSALDAARRCANEVRDALRAQRRQRLHVLEDVVGREGRRQAAEIDRTVELALVHIHTALESDLAQRARRRAELLDLQRTITDLERRLEQRLTDGALSGDRSVADRDGAAPHEPAVPGLPFGRSGGGSAIPQGSLPPGWDSEELWVSER